MKSQAGIVLLAAFLVSFLAIGLPYWQLPYARVSLPSSLYGFGLVVVLLASAACRLVPAVRLLPAFLSVGAAAPCVVMARVAYDTSADPTSHNLWPFEVIIALAVGLCVSFAGALAGGLLVSTVRSPGAGRGGS
ncbi:MAG: hypothetical protein ACREAA_02565 [Candidatus Polarisedimenticolia bacterium]